MIENSPANRASRREARERAVELAYEADIRSLSVDEVLATLLVEPEHFAVVLLRAKEQFGQRADELITARSRGWTLSRMPVLDRLVLQLAVAELLAGKTPTGVVLSEAVELAGRYSTDESSRFVNGVLAAIADDLAEEEVIRD